MFFKTGGFPLACSTSQFSIFYAFQAKETHFLLFLKQPRPSSPFHLWQKGFIVCELQHSSRLIDSTLFRQKKHLCFKTALQPVSFCTVSTQAIRQTLPEAYPGSLGSVQGTGIALVWWGLRLPVEVSGVAG